jgi:hypothetical protein
MRRNYHPSLLRVFDQPVVTTHCTQRDTSAVVLQSLTMLNDEFVLEESAAVATNVVSRCGNTSLERIDGAFRLIFNRRPDAEELAWCQEAIDRDSALARGLRPEAPPDEIVQQSLARFCQTLLNSSEFLYLR